MNKYIKMMVRLWRIITATLMLLVTLLSLSQVLARYGFNSSLVWSEETNRLLFVWLVLLGAIGADHMRIGLIADIKPYNKYFNWIAALAGLSALILLVWGGYHLHLTFAFDRYTTIDLSKSWYFFAAIIGGILWGLSMIYSIFLKSDFDGENQ